MIVSIINKLSFIIDLFIIESLYIQIYQKGEEGEGSSKNIIYNKF